MEKLNKTIEFLGKAMNNLKNVKLKENLPSNNGQFVNFNGMELEVEFEIEPYVEETRWQPAEGGHVEITGSVYANGVDIWYFFDHNVKFLDDLKQAIWEQYGNE